MPIRCIYLWVLLAAFALPAVALAPDKPIADFIRESWSVDEGLPQSAIQGMAQTRDGYLWVATHEGAARFDGHRFTVFNEANTPALGGSGIGALVAMRDGSLYLGLRDGGLVRYAQGLFTPVNPEGGLPKGNITVLVEEGAGVLWVGTGGGGLARLDNNKATLFTTANGLPHNLVNAIRPTKSGAVWIGTAGGLAMLRGGAIQRQLLDDRLDSAYVSSIIEDHRGRMWIATYGDGLYLLDQVAVQSGGAHGAPRSVAQNTLRRFSQRDGLASDTLQRIYEDRSGSIWVGTVEGLQRLRGNSFETFSSAQGLSNNYVRDLLEDVEGNFWVGTDRGIDRFRDGPILTWGVRRGIGEEFTRAVLEDRAGRVWVGTSGGLYRLDGKSVRHFTRRHGLLNNAILSLAEGRDGSLWIGTNGAGPHRLRGDHIENVGSKFGLGVASVRAIVEMRDGTVWFGTSTGLFQRRRNGTFNRVSVADGLPDDQVTSLHEDRGGTLWVGTRDGVALLAPGGRLQRHPQLGTIPRILSIGANAEGDILVTTGSGLATVVAGKTFIFKAVHGVPGRAYFNAIDDEQGHLWLCSNQGLVRLYKAELSDVLGGKRKTIEPMLYGRFDGMATAQCNGGSGPGGWRTHDGRLLFATARGVAVVQALKNRQPDLRPPPVHITGVAVDAENIPFANGVEMAPGRRRIEISYVGLNYADPDKVRYRYRLHGFDQNWVNAGSERRAVYTNLLPGTYRFQVAAGNGDGIWNEQGASVTVAYRPQFWEQRWFQVLSAMLIMVLSLTAYLTRMRRLNRQALALRRLVDERTRDLQDEKQKLEAANDEKLKLLITLNEQSEAYEKLSKQDSLTGLANRRELDRFLALEFERAWRNNRPLCVVLADLDNFKAVNDSGSHAIGDDVLRIVSRILLEGCRTIDVVARYGGEEFAIVLPETEIADARLLCERLREQVADYDWDRIHPHLKVTISFGIAANSARTVMDHDRLLDAADERLYEAKRLGRNRVCV